MKVQAGTSLTTILLNLTLGVKAKAATSLPRNAHPVASTLMNSAQDHQEDALRLVWLVDLAPVMLDLMVANSFTPTRTTIVKTLVLRAMPDSQVSKPSVEVAAVDVSVVPSLLPPLQVLQVSASLILAVVLDPIPFLIFTSAVRLLHVPVKERRV